MISDIRIVTEYNVQPVLFGSPKVFETYRLVVWETDKPINEKCYKSLSEAERAICELIYPRLNQIADKWVKFELEVLR
jgi:hypothetical protein